ncbi:MAG: DUF4097 family beta strand repeat protein [Verrucomicrobia bacterium]|nr:DUF4097 family beta strand repeat protein [Verrucomicrobiota bacterium]
MKTLFALLLLSACAASAATEEKANKTFAATSGGNLVVEVGFGLIEVVATPDRTDVSVDAWRKITRWNSTDEENYLKENPIEFVQDGNTVIVRAPKRMTWSWFGSWRNRNEANYIIHVPGNFNVTLKTSGGSITISAVSGSVKANTSGGSLRFVNIHGSVDGHTSGGNVKAADCEGEIRIGTSGGSIEVAEGSGTLSGNTSGGSITVKSFKGSVSIDTSGGGITVENIQGKINGHTSGGSIHAILLAPIPGDVDLSTSGGGITATVAPDAAFNLDAATSGGGVDCDLPLTVQGKIQRSRVTGTVNAGGPSVRLHTSGGSIRIRKY